MIKAAQIAEILSLYQKHGWILRRVLLSDELQKNLGDAPATLFGAAEIRESVIDAVWFSRPPNAAQETWELRRLSATPFALLEIFDADDEDEIREETLAEIEAQMKNALS